MPSSGLSVGQHLILERAHLPSLFEALIRKRYQLVGPTLKEGAIAYERLKQVEDLPAGWTDEQEAAGYRLKKRDDAALFGYVVGPHSWKKYLFPPQLLLWGAKRTKDGFKLAQAQEEAPPYAFIGVRACELHAIAIQDRVFLKDKHQDPHYKARRDKAFILAVNCTQAGGTCFCVSMKTGPKASVGFDLAMTEVLEGRDHYFVVQIGSAKGASLMEKLPHKAPGAGHLQAAQARERNAAGQMGKSLETAGIKELLYRNYGHPQWEEVANRCLSCANCTMVCPTCFCSTVEDITDLSGQQAQRVRKWDSCFTMDFSYIHGGSVRASPHSRYRQWMTHKLASWIDQFGTSGCVGCGRCITWCPVGIDITQEVLAIRRSEQVAAS